jgi:probable addiction module antidote protein
MNVKISEYDPTKYLETEADQIEYLSACAEFNDPKTLVVALGHVARARGGMTQLARDTGVAREVLYRALSDSGNPELGTIMKVLAALGLHMTFAPREQAA